MLKLQYDINGNKILKYIGDRNNRGFSVQTCQNLPETHRMDMDNLHESLAFNELNGYIKIYGTKRQKEILGW